MNVLAILKVLESYNEKSYIFFLVTKAIHKNKDNCDRKSAEKNVYVRILYDFMKDKVVRSRICTARLR